MSDPSKAAKIGAEAAQAAQAPHDDATVVEASGAGATAESSWSKARKKLGDASSSMGGKVTDLRSKTAAAAAAATASDGAGQVGSRRTRRARLRLSRVDPWSVMKTAFLFTIAGGIIFFISTWVIWGVINASGVFEAVNTAVTDLVASPGSETAFRLEDYVNTPKVLGFAALISSLNVVLLTALATLFSFLYNLAATVLGGLEVTLAED
ncbi:DUF3566 domain-containing protein [Luteococcus sp. Sow4_B9]|uniref:DUF3566 domain-containing protein n=1 Tax=Luteococcus sp. Sow4_B9 TaxID=3438792 RepID=UPI003F961130